MRFSFSRRSRFIAKFTLAFPLAPQMYYFFKHVVLFVEKKISKPVLIVDYFSFRLYKSTDMEYLLQGMRRRTLWRNVMDKKKGVSTTPLFCKLTEKNHNQSLVTWFSKSYSIYSFHKNLLSVMPWGNSPESPSILCLHYFLIDICKGMGEALPSYVIFSQIHGLFCQIIWIKYMDKIVLY